VKRATGVEIPKSGQHLGSTVDLGSTLKKISEIPTGSFKLSSAIADARANVVEAARRFAYDENRALEVLSAVEELEKLEEQR
jgi:hypothetical protein